jgi:hypothetical protein
MDDRQTITMLVYLCRPASNGVMFSEGHTEYEWILMVRAKERIGAFFHQGILPPRQRVRKILQWQVLARPSMQFLYQDNPTLPKGLNS